MFVYDAPAPYIQQIKDHHMGYGNLISQTDLDQGDTLHRTGGYYVILKYLEVEKDHLDRPIAEGAKEDLKKLQVGPGKYIRSPDPKSEWANRHDYLSRDQMAMGMDLMAAYGMKKELNDSWWYLMSRFGFHPNNKNGTPPKWKVPDTLGPSQIMAWIRGNEYEWARPILWVLDLTFFVDLYLRDFSKRNSWDYDQMLLVHLLLSEMKMPTSISQAAFKVYIQKENLLPLLKNYHDPKYNGIPPLYELERIAVEKARSIYKFSPPSLLTQNE